MARKRDISGTERSSLAVSRRPAEQPRNRKRASLRLIGTAGPLQSLTAQMLPNHVVQHCWIGRADVTPDDAAGVVDQQHRREVLEVELAAQIGLLVLAEHLAVVCLLAITDELCASRLFLGRPVIEQHADHFEAPGTVLALQLAQP